MPRRRSPTPLPTSIPEGWTAHEGQDLPCDDDDRPAIMHRSGLRMQAGGYRASFWLNYGQRNCWQWGELPNRYDIIAWRLSADQPG